jgi:hypothetical protein
LGLQVLDVMDKMFESIFKGLQEEHAYDIELVSQQYPVTPFEMKFPYVSLLLLASARHVFLSKIKSHQSLM